MKSLNFGNTIDSPPKSLHKTPVFLSFLPPFFGHLPKGDLSDISAGGMAAFLESLIPVGTHLSLRLELPDRSILNTQIEIKHSHELQGRHLHGMAFKNLPDYMKKKIERMGEDYWACEDRMRRIEPEICKLSCSFYNFCTKPFRIRPPQ